MSDVKARIGNSLFNPAVLVVLGMMALQLLLGTGQATAAGQRAETPVSDGVYELPNTPNGPQAGTRAELDAFGRVMEAKTPAAIIATAETFASEYKQSQLLPLVRLREMQAEMDANSYEGAVSIGHEMLSKDPRNLEALLLMGSILPDFPPRYAAQRESILGEARKDLQSASQLLQTFHLPQGASPERFMMNKRGMMASLAEAQGFVDLVAGQYRDSIESYKRALALRADPSAVTALRLGQAYYGAGDLGNARVELEQAVRSPSTLIRQKAASLLSKVEISERATGRSAHEAQYP